MESSRFEVETIRRDGAPPIVRLVGELDIADADTAVAALAAVIETEPAVAVDLSGLSFIDSHGIRALLRVRQAAAEHSSRLVLVSPQDAIRRTLKLVDLDAVFEITDDVSILGGGGGKVLPGDPGPG